MEIHNYLRRAIETVLAEVIRNKRRMHQTLHIYIVASTAELYNEGSQAPAISGECMEIYRCNWRKYWDKYGESCAQLIYISTIWIYRLARYVLRLQMAIATMRRAELMLVLKDQYILLSSNAVMALGNALGLLDSMADALDGYPTICMRIIKQFARLWPYLVKFIQNDTGAAPNSLAEQFAAAVRI